MRKRYTVQVSFPTREASPPEMEEFYESLTPTLREDKWYFQEYAIRGKHKSVRTIGFQNLTTIQASKVAAKARQYLPKVKVVKRSEN